MALTIGSGVRVGGGTAVGIPPSISIASHPIDVSAYAYETTSFATSASSQYGSVVSYQWQVQVGGTGSWANIPNATGSSFSTGTLAVSGFHGNKYRALITGTRGAEPVYTTEVTLSVLAATINVTSSPSNQSVMSGSTATFSASATVNMGAVVSYQWQIYTSGTGQWSNIAGATSSTYTTSSLVSGDDGNKYRVYITSGKGATPVTTTEATLTVQSLQANSMIIGSFVEAGSGTEYYGAEAAGGWFNNMGAISSSVIFSVYKVVNSGYSNNNYAYVRFNDGNYGGFSISGGVFVGEQVSYDRIITIGGQNYHFKYDGNQYFNDGRSIIDLQNYVGQSVSLVYDNTIQPSYNPGTLIVGTSVPNQWDGSYYYGASDYLYSTVGVIGTMNNPMFSSVAYYYYPNNPSMSRTIITLHDGNYGSTSVVGGRIGSDSTGGGASGFYYRIFNCNGTNMSFRWTGVEYEYTYSDSDAGDPFALRLTVGQELYVQYDPTMQGPGGGVTVTGNMFVMSQYGTYYGASSGYVTQAYGTLWSFPSMVYQIQYDSNQVATTIYFLAGHYSDVVITSSTIDGKTNASFVLGGVTRTGTLSSGGGAGPTLRFTGDPFSLQTKEYNMLSFSLTMTASSGGGGGGGTPVTLSLSTSSSPSGYFFPPMGTSMFASHYYSGEFYFNTPTDANTFKTAAPTSFTFNDPYSGTMWTISGVSNISGSYVVSLSWTSASPTSPSSGMTPSVTFTGAGSGTSTTYVAGVDYMDGSTGPYGIYFAGPGYMAGVQLDQAAWLNMAGFTALTALTSGSTFTATMASTGSAPYTITVSGSWTGPSSNPFISASSSPSINISGPYYNHVPATITISSGGSSGGSTVTANLLTMNSPSGFYDPPNSSSMMSPSSTWGVFFFSTTEDATAIDNANPTSITYNDPYGGTKWTLSPVTNIYYSGSGSPSGYAVSIQWGSATPTGPSTGMTPTISYASAGGGGGGPVSISNIAGIWYDDYASPAQATFYFANSSDATTAYGLLNGPGTWYITGNYMLQIYGMQYHGTYSITAMGPSTTDSMGPPGMQYRVIMPSSISNPQSDGPATNGPFSAHK